MSPDADFFTDAQQHSIGVCLSQLDEHLRTLRGVGVDHSTLGRIEQTLEAFAEATGARRPQPPRNTLNATLVQMLVLEEELRPRRMTAYGELSDEAARVLDANVQALVGLTQALIAQIESAKR